MKIGPRTRIGPLLDTYPFLTEVLAGYAPEFGRLRNPIMRKTLGSVATLSMAAGLGGVELDALIDKVAETIRLHAGEQPEVEKGAGDAGGAGGGPQVAGDAQGAAGDDGVPAGGDGSPTGADEQAARRGRVETLKSIIRDLHAGTDREEITERFAELVRDVSPSEIAEMEQQLVAEGLPETEIKRLCDVHAEIFRRSLEGHEELPAPPGHPIHTMRKENEALGAVISWLNTALAELGTPPSLEKFRANRRNIEEAFNMLFTVERHYLRKEYEVFPILEKYGVDAPPKVMWAVHDDIRDLIKAMRRELMEENLEALLIDAKMLFKMVEDMFFKEERILFPLCLQVFNDEDWVVVRDGSEEFGYSLVTPGDEWQPKAPETGPTGRVGATGVARDTGELRRAERRVEEAGGRAAVGAAEGLQGIPLKTGSLTVEQVQLLFGHLPVDVTFVDENDEVRYYSEGDRIFPRSPGVIGRKVQNCHPPKSVHIVQRILEEFRAGTKDVAEFWLELGGRFIYIRYFAVRDAERHYKGTLEVVQDATRIRQLEGQRRLLDW